MSTTVVQQRTTRFPGKGLGMSLAGLAIAALIGFGIANLDDAPSQAAVVSPETGVANRLYIDQPAVTVPVEGAIVLPEAEFGGMLAPTWKPNWDAIESIRSDRHWFGLTPPSGAQEPDTGGVNNTEPFGYPNYGRLDTYLGNGAESGPR